MNPSETPSPMDKILDLLLDALAERQAARQQRPGPAEDSPPPLTKTAAVAISTQGAPEDLAEAGASPEMRTPELSAERRGRARPGQAALEPEPSLAPRQAYMQPEPELPPLREDEPEAAVSSPPAPLPAGQMGRTLMRLSVALLILIVVINIPFNRHNVSLARAMPDSAALIIRDGLLVKGADSDEIYVMEDEKLRWISSLEAFEQFGYRWRDVHIVEESFLEKFEQGAPLHLILKCQSSPHIYRIERGEKRWIKDIPTFLAEGHVWEDVRLVSCEYLRNLPDGLPIPPDAGPPPQP